MINYQNILDKNLLNVVKEILKKISVEGIDSKNQIYITFFTNYINNSLPDWLLKKHPDKITILIQYEYYNLVIKENFFLITLSFNNTKADLKIYYNSIVSIADPLANFGLVFKNEIQKAKKKSYITNKKEIIRDNVINFKKYKKKLN